MKIRKAHYTKNGESRVAGKLYGDFYDHCGIRRRIPLFDDQKNSLEAARAIERMVSIRASGEMLPPDLRRFVENTLPRIRDKLSEWHIVDPGAMSGVQSLDELVDLWEKSLADTGVDVEYVNLKSTRVRQLLRDAGMHRWQDIRPDAVRAQLTDYRKAEKRPMSVATSNHYLQAIKQFCKWIVDEKKLALASPLVGMKKLDDGNALKHARRGLEIEEFHVLIAYLEHAPTVSCIPAPHRALIYTFAVETGLRLGAIERLTVKRVEMQKGKPAVFVPKRNRIKYGADRWIPLGDELWSLLKPLIEGRSPADKVFTLPTRGHASKMVKSDLKGARDQWLNGSHT